MRRSRHVHAFLLGVCLAGSRLVAQSPAPIADNSFLIEEAYHPEAGVVQHISLWSRDWRRAGDWVYSFTSLAYRPLSDEEFGTYVDFAATPEGQALNATLFTAFNDLFTEISHDLGVSAARFMSGEDI